MLITRTPISITLCGSDTRERAACTLALNHYVYVCAKEAPCEVDTEQENYDQVSFYDVKEMPGYGCAFAVGQANARSLVLDMKALTKEALARQCAALGKGPLELYYGAAFGGLNYFEFMEDGSVGIEPLILDPKQIALLSQHLMLFHVGPKRLKLTKLCDASEYAKVLTKGSPKDLGSLFGNEEYIPGSYGCMFEGEYLLVVAPPKEQDKILSMGLKHIPFAIDWKGSVSFYAGE